MNPYVFFFFAGSLYLKLTRLVLDSQSAIPKTKSSTSLSIPRLPALLATLGILSVGTFFGMRWYRLLGHGGGPGSWPTVGKWIGVGIGFFSGRGRDL